MYNLLREKVGEQQAKTLTDYINQQVDINFEKQKSLLATKEDIAKLETKIAESKSDIIKWVFSFFVAVALMVIGLYLKK